MKQRFLKIPSSVSIAFLLVFLPASLCLGAQPGSAAISWFMLTIGLIGGLALFLYGMEKMSDGMKKTAGNRMRVILAALTKNRFRALGIGAFVTMVIQSSSATTVMLVSFVQAGLMSFSQSLGVILGADIGTTVTAQLIAFKFTDYALLMITLGFGARMLARTDNIKNIGEIMLGFGILFYGMKLMSDTMAPLRDSPVFIVLMTELENPFFGLLTGALFTALVQSSGASIGLIIVLSYQGLITLEAGIPIMLGANVGTCITAVLASINSSREAKRVALAHVLFKIAGVLLFIFWIPAFAELIKAIGYIFGSNTARQIANAHTIFNVSLGIIFLPFIPVFSKLITKLLPDKETAPDIKLRTMYLDESSISSPAIAIELARKEISNLSLILSRTLKAVIIPFVSDQKWINNDDLSEDEKSYLKNKLPHYDERNHNLSVIDSLDMREENIDFLNDRINDFLLQVAKQEISENQANEIYGMISIANDMESIGDLIHRNLVKLIHKKKAIEMDFSDEGKEELMIYHGKVCRQIDILGEAFAERNPEKARRIMEKERKYLDLEAQYRIRHLERVRHNQKSSMETHEVHMELMDILKQIVVYTSNIAKTFLK